MHYYFDPSEYIKGLQQLLISDKKKIGFLFGAGTSLAKRNELSLNIPAIGQLTDDIVEKLKVNALYQSAISDIKIELGEDFSIETLLSNLELKKEIVCSGKLNGIGCIDISDMIIEIKSLLGRRLVFMKK